MEELAARSVSHPTWWQALRHPRVVCILFLGFSSGLPLAITSSTLQAWYAVSGIDVVTVGVLTLVGVPYVWKFLWAPLMDRFRLPFLGRRRGWILLTQFLLMLGIGAMAFFNPKSTPWMLGAMGLFVAFMSASQDINIDAYRTDLLKPEERGIGAAMNTAGYRIAMLVSGGLALVMAGEIGFRATYLILAGLMAVQMIVTYLAPHTGQIVKAPETLYSAITDAFSEFFSRKSAILVLIFIVLYKMGDAFALSLTSYFLIKGLHFSLLDVGAIYKVVGLIATLIGVFIGGLLMVRMGLYRSLMLFGILQAISNLTFVLLAIAGKNYLMMVVAIAAEYTAGGLGTVAFVAFLMALCDHRFTATQFALLSALASIGRVFVGPMAGIMVEHIGWIHFYFWTFIFALPGLVVLRYLKLRVDFTSDKLI